MSKQLLLFDRSRSTADWECPRSRYLNYEADGRGYVPESSAYELSFGSAIHTGLASIAQGQLDGNIDIDTITTIAAAEVVECLRKNGSKTEEYILEQAALVEGMLGGFHRHLWPRLMAQYPKILAIEQEMAYKYHSVLFMAKPDLVAVDKNGEVVYVEYKSTSSKKDEWINSWNTAIQLHATTRAIEASLGEAIGAVQVIGLYKGYQNYGKQTSIFPYAYKRNGQPPFSHDDFRYDYAAGFKKYPVWEMPGGVKTWVEGMPETLLGEQFPCTPPIFISDSMVEAFFAQRNLREQEINMAKMMLETTDDPVVKKDVLNTAFEQNFSKCSPAWGYGCPYKKFCFGEVAEPLKQGFCVRESHHAIEADTWKLEDQIK